MSILYAQSGGPTPVLNAQAAFLLQEANAKHIEVFGALNGIQGILSNHIRPLKLKDYEIERLKYTPGAFLGSCRLKLPEFSEQTNSFYRQIFEQLRSYHIDTIVYNGGNDSADTACKLFLAAQALHLPIKVFHLPKTIDNDLHGNDITPGFLTSAFWLCQHAKLARLDLKSMSLHSTKVLIIETMGRDTGWLAAASAFEFFDNQPYLTIVPEIEFTNQAQNIFIHKLNQKIQQFGHCIITVAEGVKIPNEMLADIDAFGHAKKQGAGHFVEQLIHKTLNIKTHLSIPDYLQRSATLLRPQADLDIAKSSVSGFFNAKATNIKGGSIQISLPHISGAPFQIKTNCIDLTLVANHVRSLPKSFIHQFEPTNELFKYLDPLFRQPLTQCHFNNGFADTFEL